MLVSTPQDIVSAFEQAKNTNAAIKKFLKNEVSGNAQNARFAKSLRVALLSPKQEIRVAFVEDHLPDYEPHFLVVARYAFHEAISQITLDVVTKYADDFNTTYKTSDEKVVVTNKAKFEKIVKEVLAMVDEGIKKHNLTPGAFLTKVMLCNIFDQEVLEEVLPLVGK